MPKRTFTKQYMLDTLDDQASMVRDRITGVGRWSINHEMIFKGDDGKMYRAHYRVAATESQDESPWEHESEIVATEVVAVQVQVTDYENAP